MGRRIAVVGSGQAGLLAAHGFVLPRSRSIPSAGKVRTSATKFARHVVAAVAAAPDATFDAGWMTRTFEAF